MSDNLIDLVLKVKNNNFIGTYFAGVSIKKRN